MGVLSSLDFVWKLLFFSTVLSFFYFMTILVSTSAFKNYSVSKKVATLKTIALFVVLSLVLTSFYLLVSDRDIIADCFGKFASKEGVFGLTRLFSGIWMTVTLGLLLRDFWLYRRITTRLQKSIQCQRTLEVNQKAIQFNEVSDQFEPVVAGGFTPQIFVPESLVRNKTALSQILCHEWVHVQNHDGLWSLLNLLIHRLNWHNPVALFSLSKMKTQIEMATDELAVQEFSLNISDYAQQLVSLVSARSLKSPLLMSVSGDFLQIQSRLANLKRLQSGKVKLRSFYAGFALVLFLFGLSQGYAAIVPQEPKSVEIRMCLQVNHELMIESWLKETSGSEANKCE